MTKLAVFDQQATRRILIAALILALAVAFAVVRPQPVQADDLTPPAVPANIQVPEGNSVFLVGHARGTQNYICMPSGKRYAWTFVGPQATLFDDSQEQITTHFLSPNPVEGGTARATWQHSQDTSSVWAAAIASSTDPDFVAQGAIPWLLLRIVGSQNGPNGGDRLSATTFIQRVNTTGGVAPSTGCNNANDVGQRAFMDYTADYYFFR
jgi:hypothetical protein